MESLNQITCSPDTSLRAVETMMATTIFPGVPVIDKSGRLAGYHQPRYERFEEDLDRPVSEVMTSEGLVCLCGSGTTLEVARRIRAKHKIEKVPLVDGDGYLRGLITLGHR